MKPTNGVAAMELATTPALRVKPSHWTVLQSLTMRVRALVDAAHALEDNDIARKPQRVEDALLSLEAEIEQQAERVAEEMLYTWLSKLPKKPERPSLNGDIPDLIGLA